jgi:hypothetical protein
MIPLSKQTLLSFLFGGGVLLFGIGVFSLSNNMQSRLRANIFVSSSEVTQSTKEVGVSTREIISIQAQTPTLIPNISSSEIGKVSTSEIVHSAPRETPNRVSPSQPIPIQTLGVQENTVLLYTPSPLPVPQQDPLRALTSPQSNTIPDSGPLPVADTRRAIPPTRPRPAINPF